MYAPRYTEVAKVFRTTPSVIIKLISLNPSTSIPFYKSGKSSMGVNRHGSSIAIARVASNSLPILHIPNQNVGMLIEGTHWAIDITGYNYINPS